MKAVILAGGFGTRLRSVVSDLPKPLAPVNGKYFLEYLLEQLKTNGIYEFIFCVHYMADKIMNHFGNGERFGVRIDYSVETEPLGTGGAIGLCRQMISETFCVLNADTYLDLDIQDCLRRHQGSGAFLTMAVAHMVDTGRYGQVQIQTDGRIGGFEEKGAPGSKSGYINAGFYIVEPRIFTYIPPIQNVSLEQDVFPAFFRWAEKINSYSNVEHFFDIGVPEDYYRFQRWIDERKLADG
ncbi:MAG TPA: nucleotidyltransferase family protein [Paenibacillus sp.]|uniref:nucleotidyltransferase family protein n=1 Tax=Paenibacillus sp. TaxID=58172 RepID=UPI002CA33567|nr:nucleotidyltransferase family protein [Paenibacillus sp.]HUC92005.1 nucleotidyltransferase family protein [Paenibacillus sp.]